MKLSRILSIFVVMLAIVAVGCITVFIFSNKNDKSKSEYADSINFLAITGSLEICIDNEIIIDKSMVKILPSDCVLEPEFTLKEYGESEDEAKIIDEGKLSFESKGKYILSCRVKSSENYYAKDSIIINVVEDVTNDTSIYIKKTNYSGIYVEDEIEVDKLIKMKYPTNTNVEFKCSEHFSVENNMISVVNSGIGTIEVYLTYDKIVVYEKLLYTINPKITEENTYLVISYKGNVITNNTIELEYSALSSSFNYQIANLDSNQEINCWTDSPLVQIISFNSPVVVFKTLGIGEAVIYISPVNYSNIVFEIVIAII